MHSLIITFVAAALLAISAVDAASETNAQRFARGLPPNPPKLLRRGTTPVFGAKRSTPSSTPGSFESYPAVEYDGLIVVVPSSGRGLGYVKNWASSINGVNLEGGTDSDNNLHVKFTTTTSADPFDILATNPKFPAPYYVGISSNPGTILAPGSSTRVELKAVAQVPANSAAGNQSAIWTIDPATRQLRPQYVNPDGSKPETIIAYDIRENELFFVGDLDAWNKQHTDTPASAVKFVLTNLS